MTDHARQPFHVGRKSLGARASTSKIHLSPPRAKLNLLNYLILIPERARPSDSVVIARQSRAYSALPHDAPRLGAFPTRSPSGIVPDARLSPSLSAGWHLVLYGRAPRPPIEVA